MMNSLLSYTDKDMLGIISFFFFQFPFCLLHLPYFSSFTPDTYSLGFVFLCSHISAISISQPVFKVKIPAFFFFCLFFSRSYCYFFVFLPILSFIVLLQLSLFYSFFLILTGAELSTLPAFSVLPHQLLYNFQSIFAFFSNFLSLPPGHARQAIHFQKQKTSSKPTEKSLSKTRQVISVASISGDGSKAVSQGAGDVVWGSSWDATTLLAVREANNFPLGGR